MVHIRIGCSSCGVRSITIYLKRKSNRNHFSGLFTGIYISNSLTSCQKVLETSRANIVVVEDLSQSRQIHGLRNQLPDLKAIVQISKLHADDLKLDEDYYCWDELLTMSTDDVDIEYSQRLAEIKAGECCALVFTSGTSGDPKGAMISHDNFTWTIEKIASRLDISEYSNEVTMSYLPLSHMAGQLMEVFLPISKAATVYFAEKDAMKLSFMQTLTEVRPTYFIAVPRIYEKLQKRMQELENIGAFEGINFPLDQKKAALGLDRCRSILTCGAPMNNDTKMFFNNSNLPIREWYGMTEAVTVSMSLTDQCSLNSNVGKSLGHSQIKIDNPNGSGRGEICVKGRQVMMGYVKDEKKTCEIIDDDRWLHTGDYGFVDKDGNIFISGRVKEIIITSGGENIAPGFVESLVKAECLAISNAFLIGDNRNFLSILLTLKTQMDNDGAPVDKLASETVEWLREIRAPGYKTLSEILLAGPDPKVLEAFQEIIDRANKNSISKAQKIQKFAILPQDFSFPTGELGPSMKLRRNVVLQKYQAIIEKFYDC